MIKKTTKLQWRRKVKSRQRQIEGIGSSTEESLDKLFFRRLGRLYNVRRFILSWILLVVALIGAVVVQTRALGDYYLRLKPVEGGIYSEGMIGSYTNSNPIFASSDVDTSVSKLLYSGLLTYDKNNNLVGDIAREWSLDDTGKEYTFKLRDDIKWHDGRPLTSADVLFTFGVIQNPDTRSPYFSSWQGIKLSAPDEYTVSFKLPNVLASFPHSLTSGIIPKHILEAIEPTNLRGTLFNTVEPIGTGPFRWGDVEVYGDTAELREQRIALIASENYHRGEPKLGEFIIRAYLEETPLIQSFQNGELNAVAGALSMPLSGGESTELNIPLTGAVMVFFRTTQEILTDAKVRRALSAATDQKAIIRQINKGGKPVYGPLIEEHIGYNKDITQYLYNLEQANNLLNDSGWKLDEATGIRMKDGKPLKLSLNTLSSAEYAAAANILQKQWRQAGVDLTVNSLAQRDLQTVIDERSYDTLMYGIVMGTDADQFAYWHSSQADVRSQRRLNFSDYKSAAVDSALEAGRTRVDTELRSAKYLPFLQTWREDAPAVALYRPRFVYTTFTELFNFVQFNGMNSPVDRFNNVEEWMIRTDRAAE